MCLFKIMDLVRKELRIKLADYFGELYKVLPDFTKIRCTKLLKPMITNYLNY